MSALCQKRTSVGHSQPVAPGCVRGNSSVSFVTLAISGRHPDGRPAADLALGALVRCICTSGKP